MFKRVLLCYDGSQAGRRALKRGAELAVLLGAQVHVLSIIPPGIANAAVNAGAVGYACLVEDSGQYRKLLDESLEWLKARGVMCEGYLATGDILDQIAAHAKRLAIDLIVLGHYPQPAAAIGGRVRGSAHRWPSGWVAAFSWRSAGRMQPEAMGPKAGGVAQGNTASPR